MKRVVEARTLKAKIECPYRWSTGRAIGSFLTELRDGRRIVGLRCDRCGKTIVPPQDYCIYCADELDEWVEVSDQGEVTTFTEVKMDFPNSPLEPPFAYIVVKLDGADTGLAHLARNPEGIVVGSRVRAVWKELREGSIRDIDYFELVK
ncbi:MAG: Zn-ribbon domain-containing OB-fold protein [Actinobacteria bacterium]|nr:Zn-ribbon domain-containing OB-fold protein [Actinomycetota bacterium]